MRRWARKKPSKLTQTEFDFLKVTCLAAKGREKAAAATAMAGRANDTTNVQQAAAGLVSDAVAPTGSGSPARVSQPAIRPEGVDRGFCSFRG